MQKRILVSTGGDTEATDTTAAPASKHGRRPITAPEPYKPPSGKYSNGLESLDNFVGTCLAFKCASSMLYCKSLILEANGSGFKRRSRGRGGFRGGF